MRERHQSSLQSTRQTVSQTGAELKKLWNENVALEKELSALIIKKSKSKSQHTESAQQHRYARLLERQVGKLSLP